MNSQPGNEPTRNGPGSQRPERRKPYLFDRPNSVRNLLRCFYAALLVLLIVDPFIPRHPHFPWESWPEFYAAYGLVACVVLVVAAKYILRPLVKRREDYYE